jgi:uncharacterized protein (TIGR02246 family)
MSKVIVDMGMSLDGFVAGPNAGPHNNLGDGARVFERIENRVAEEEDVRDLYRELMNGWNRGDGEAFAAVFAEDGDLVAFDGTHFEGRAEIAPFHQELFDRWMKRTRLIGRVKDVRFLSPDVALMHAVGSTIMRGKSEPSPERDSIRTLVAVRRDGEWRLATFHNTRLRMMRSGITVLVSALSDLLWWVFRLNKRTAYR